MVQKLNHSELKDITDIVYYTNLKQKNLVLRNTFVLGYSVVGTLLCWVVGASLIRVASGVSVFLFLCSLICLCVVIYILICRFLEKRRCRKRVQEKETGEFNVHFRKDYMLYDQQTFSLKRFKKVYLYHDLYFFVDSENVVIVKKCQEVDRAIHKTPYLKVQKKMRYFVCCKRIFLFYNAFDVYPAFVTISINSSAVCSCLDKIVTVLSSVFTLA